MSPLKPEDIALVRQKLGKLLVYDGERYGLFRDRFRRFLIGEKRDPIAEALGEVRRGDVTATLNELRTTIQPRKKTHMNILVGTGRAAVEMAQGILRDAATNRRDSFYFAGANWGHLDTIDTLLLVSGNMLQYAGSITAIRRADPANPASSKIAARIRDFDRVRARYDQERLKVPAVLLDLEPCSVAGVPLLTRHRSEYPFTLSHRYFADLSAFRHAFLGK